MGLQGLFHPCVESITTVNNCQYYSKLNKAYLAAVCDTWLQRGDPRLGAAVGLPFQLTTCSRRGKMVKSNNPYFGPTYIEFAVCVLESSPKPTNNSTMHLSSSCFTVRNAFDPRINCKFIHHDSLSNFTSNTLSHVTGGIELAFT